MNRLARGVVAWVAAVSGLTALALAMTRHGGVGAGIAGAAAAVLALLGFLLLARLVALTERSRRRR